MELLIWVYLSEQIHANSKPFLFIERTTLTEIKKAENYKSDKQKLKNNTYNIF